MKIRQIGYGWSEILKCHHKLRNFRRVCEDYEIIWQLRSEYELKDSILAIGFSHASRSYIEIYDTETAIEYFNVLIGVDEEDPIYKWGCLQKSKALIVQNDFKEAYEIVCKIAIKNPNDISALILLTVVAKELEKPYKNFTKKIMKICEESVEPLREALEEVCPDYLQPSFLDALVTESGRAENFVAFRQSFQLLIFH